MSAFQYTSFLLFTLVRIARPQPVSTCQEGQLYAVTCPGGVGLYTAECSGGALTIGTRAADCGVVGPTIGPVIPTLPLVLPTTRYIPPLVPTPYIPPVVPTPYVPPVIPTFPPVVPTVCSPGQSRSFPCPNGPGTYQSYCYNNRWTSDNSQCRECTLSGYPIPNGAFVCARSISGYTIVQCRNGQLRDMQRRCETPTTRSPFTTRRPSGGLFGLGGGGGGGGLGGIDPIMLLLLSGLGQTTTTTAAATTTTATTTTTTPTPASTTMAG